MWQLLCIFILLINQKVIGMEKVLMLHHTNEDDAVVEYAVFSHGPTMLELIQEEEEEFASIHGDNSDRMLCRVEDNPNSIRLVVKIVEGGNVIGEYNLFTFFILK